MEKTVTGLTRVLKKKKKPGIRDDILKEFPFAIGSIPFVWQILFFYLPILLLISTSLVSIKSSFNCFQTVFTLGFFHILSNSFLLSSITTVACLFIGFPLAYCIAFHGGKAKTLLIFLLVIPFWTNFILHIFAWSFVLEKNGFMNALLLNIGLIKTPIHFLNTHFATYVMSIYYYLPFMILPIYSALEKFDITLLEASLDLGASRFHTMKRVLIPLTLNAIRVGVLLVFIPSFGEFIIPEFMGGDKSVYVGSAISFLMAGEDTASTAMIFAVAALLFLLPAVFFIDRSLARFGKKLAGGSL
jgi:ABC-type spermidine/putrescine transport system permease subunit I